MLVALRIGLPVFGQDDKSTGQSVDAMTDVQFPGTYDDALVSGRLMRFLTQTDC